MNKECAEKLKSSLLAFLRAKADDRGAMAALRCALLPDRESKAWPYLCAAGCDLCEDDQKTIASCVATAFALAPAAKEGVGLRIGELMRRIAQDGPSGEKGLSTFEERLLRLLACDSRKELAAMLPPIFQTARQKGLAIAPEALFDDLHYWGEDVKRHWAQQFWGRSKE